MMMYVSIYMADCIVEGGFVDIFVEDFPVEKGFGDESDGEQYVSVRMSWWICKGKCQKMNVLK